MGEEFKDSKLACVQLSSFREVALALCYEREALKRVAMDSKYGSAWDGWCSNEVHGSYRVRIWKNIRRGWGNFLAILDL
jgi:hypothetical protein